MEKEYELIQNDERVAATSGVNAFNEIKHYAWQYGQDSPVEVFEVTRRKIDLAAAPQVVADDRELPPLPACHDLMPFKGYPVTSGICCYTAQQMAEYARAAISADPLHAAVLKFIGGWDKAHRDEKYDELIFSALPCIEEMRAAANFMTISKSWEICPTLETYTSAALAAAPVQAQEPVAFYAECRKCSECNHTGINDAKNDAAACFSCEWIGDSPKEDVCPGCSTEGSMGAACPKCGSLYELMAESNVFSPVSEQKPIGYAPTYLIERIAAGDAAVMLTVTRKPLPGHGVTVALYTAPVQPVAVPDGPSAEDYSDMLRDFFFRYSAGGYNDDGGLVPLAKAKDKLQWVIDEEGKRAAPAAQGDSKDAERLDWVAHHGAALRIDSNNKWYVDAPYHTGVSCVDDHKRFPTPSEAIDAAIAAKAAS